MKLQKQNIPFTQIANEVLNDPSLSWQAKGMFAYLFSKPDNWEFAVNRITQESSDGSWATRHSIKELEDNGYLTRKRQYTGKILYELKYSKPFVENQQQASKKPLVENRKVRKPQSAETNTISNKEDKVIKKLSNKEKSSTKIYTPLACGSKKSKKRKTPNPEISQVVDYFRSQLDVPEDQPSKSRFMARHFLNKAKKFLASQGKPESMAFDLCKAVIDAAMEDSFHSKNATNLGYIYRHSSNIMKNHIEKRPSHVFIS